MPDYAALARQFGAVSSEPAQPAAGGVDYAALAKQFGGQSEPAPEASTSTTQPSGFEHFAGEFWKRANPLSWVEGLVEAAKHPVDSALNIVRADPAFLTQAKAAADKGDLYTAGRKVLSYLSMGFGHDLDTQADMIAKGDLAGAGGAMAGTAAQFLAPEAAARSVGAVSSAARMQPANPAIADAVRFGREQGVPMDAATATDNMAVRAAQHISDRSIGGSQVAGRAAQAQQEGLATLGEQLAAKGHPVPVSAEHAGRAIGDSLEASINDYHQQANDAYGELRAIAQRNKEVVPTRAPKPIAEDAPFDFVGRSSATPDEVFDAVHKDAVSNGYTGSPADLRRAFDERLSTGWRGLEDQAGDANEVGDVALLKEIRRLGGIKPFTREMGTGAKLRGDFDALAQTFNAKSGYGQRGGASIFRNDGLGLDDVVDQLRANPKWRPLVQDENGLLDQLDRIARKGPRGAVRPSVEKALALSDVRPGSQWWVKPVEEEQAIPVNLAPIRPQLQPIYEELDRQRKLTPFVSGSGKARAFDALDRLLKGPRGAGVDDFAPLETADEARSELLQLVRGKDGGGLASMRTAGQGIASRAASLLDAEIRRSASAAGPDALAALERGRAATTAKHAVNKVYESIRDEPVKAFDQAVSRNDTAIDSLRDVAKHAPKELPKIGRAYLDRLMDSATAEGGFGRTDKLFADWQKLGPETKQLLFPDPAHRANLDRFFLLAKQMGKNANPSGTAHAAAIAAQGGGLLWSLFHGDVAGLAEGGASVGASAGISSFLHSPIGVKLLTEGLGLPPSKGAQAAWLSKVRKFAAAQGAVLGSARQEGSATR
jgi:hypothetical protein